MLYALKNKKIVPLFKKKNEIANAYNIKGWNIEPKTGKRIWKAMKFLMLFWHIRKNLFTILIIFLTNWLPENSFLIKSTEVNPKLIWSSG